MAGKSRAAMLKSVTKEQLFDQMEELKAQLRNAPAQTSTAATAARETATKARDAVKGISVDTIVQTGAKFGLELQRTVSGLTEQIVQNAEQLQNLETAIAAATEEVERLYNIEVASASIQALIEDFQAKREALQKEADVLRAAWAEEASTHTRTVAQRNRDLETARQREQQDYEYRTSVQRARQEEEFNHKMLIEQRNEAERVATVNARLAEREKAVADAEVVNEKLRIRVEGIPAEIEKATKEAVAAAVGATRRDLANQHALELKDRENALNVERQKVAATESANARLAQEVEKLTAQLNAARDQVTSITKTALEASSGQQALQSMKEFVKDSTPARNGTKS